MSDWNISYNVLRIRYRFDIKSRCVICGYETYIILRSFYSQWTLKLPCKVEIVFRRYSKLLIYLKFSHSRALNHNTSQLNSWINYYQANESGNQAYKHIKWFKWMSHETICNTPTKSTLVDLMHVYRRMLVYIISIIHWTIVFSWFAIFIRLFLFRWPQLHFYKQFWIWNINCWLAAINLLFLQ